MGLEGTFALLRQGLVVGCAHGDLFDAQDFKGFHRTAECRNEGDAGEFFHAGCEFSLALGAQDVTRGRVGEHNHIGLNACKHLDGLAQMLEVTGRSLVQVVQGAHWPFGHHACKVNRHAFGGELKHFLLHRGVGGRDQKSDSCSPVIHLCAPSGGGTVGVKVGVELLSTVLKGPSMAKGLS